MLEGRVEKVILKGANEYSDGYITNTTLEALSGYQEFEGLYIMEQPILAPDNQKETYASGFKGSSRNYRLSLKLASRYQPYPTSALNVREYIVDNSGNKFIDVLNCRYHWVQNTGTHLYELVPTTEASYTTKNLSINIEPTFEQNAGLVRTTLNCESTGYI